MSRLPTCRPVALLRVIDVVPVLYPAVQFGGKRGSRLEFVSPFLKQMLPPSPPHGSPDEKVRSVWFGPAPRNVTLLLLLKRIPIVRSYMPAFRKTTCPLGHDAIAALMSAAVAPGFNVAQIVVRLGIPPGTPAAGQLMLRLGATIACCATPVIDADMRRARQQR